MRSEGHTGQISQPHSISPLHPDLLAAVIPASFILSPPGKKLGGSKKGIK